jgi:hypothetical protein
MLLMIDATRRIIYRHAGTRMTDTSVSDSIRSWSFEISSISTEPHLSIRG